MVAFAKTRLNQAKNFASGPFDSFLGFRIRDESAGETLQLRAESQAMILTARFDPADHATERGTRVDFTARRPVESPTAFAATLKRFLAQ